MESNFDRELKDYGGGYLPTTPQIEFLYRIVVHCDSPIDIGISDNGYKRIIPIIGGQFEGPQLKGTVLPIGADWNTASNQDSGKRTVDTRYLLETEEGEVISLSTLGYSYRSREVMAMRESGQRVDPDLYYFKQHIFFETASEKYKWLNSVVAFGVVMSKFQGGPGVIYDAYYLK
ncbi:MAG: DUF3237 domain-containing protein [Spirochaetia bacterium]|nr:DUF3237 domain-containing protein [Spirochaetia bacterium]